jgi:RNA polymerase sigma factor (sigma-70 family)
MGVEMLDLEVANPLDARNRLVMRELDQVRYIAAKIREGLPRSVSIEDLVSAGVLGLVEATETYDRTKPTKFKTFARFRIQGAIIDSMRQVDWAPRLLRKQGREIDQTICQLELAMGRTPDESEIAEGVGKPLAELQKTLRELDSLGIAGQQSSSTFNSAETVDLIESAPSRASSDSCHSHTRETTTRTLLHEDNPLFRRSQSGRPTQYILRPRRDSMMRDHLFWPGRRSDRLPCRNDVHRDSSRDHIGLKEHNRNDEQQQNHGIAERAAEYIRFTTH